ncbi:WYL domain-containing protein [Rufibacter hautae]|uniref:WYL domain-containing protein n=1 Tax=Rufibacter hautae TaxID=2595005 RepID=A0A5B6TEK6_9BACT|nr:WYL domain-containing protein [Rufibacter hautae]KAA3437670.1 WYL domain-containing protein [Rufibacter hautae]
MNKFPFSLGDIVAIKTHPFIEGMENVLIGGDSGLLSPLMVIVEVVKENEGIRDQKTGHQVRSEYKCLCKWFSHKTYSFEEKWLNDEQLKLVQRAKDIVDVEELYYGKEITFSTHALESNKKKISTQFEDIYFSDNSTKHALKNNVTINPLLSYQPPVMQVCCVKQNEIKEPLFDRKKGHEIRKVSKIVVKCLWFNALLNKFSEEFLPVESITIINYTATLAIKLKQIKEAIEENKFLRFSRKGKKSTIVKPKSFIYDGGYYKLRGFDYFLNRFGTFEVNDLLNLETLHSPFVEKAPNFNLLSLETDLTEDLFNNKIFDSILDIINKAKSLDQYVRIHYKNRQDKFSTRTLKANNLYTSSNRKLIFIDAFCQSKEEERTFRVDRIQQAEILNLKISEVGTPDDLQTGSSSQPVPSPL